MEELLFLNTKVQRFKKRIRRDNEIDRLDNNFDILKRDSFVEEKNSSYKKTTSLLRNKFTKN